MLFGANECVGCHKESGAIRDASSGMFKALLEVAQKAGHEQNDCIVCHGGTPTAKKKNIAHSGTVEYFKTNKGPKEFYSQPSAASVNKNTCGTCHENQVLASTTSLMATNQEKIQDTLQRFGVKNRYDVGMYKTQNPKELHERLGTLEYQQYMQKLQALEPHAFAQELKKLPPVPTAKELQKEPELAAFAYLKEQKSEATQEMRCASCHMPHAKDGKLVHSIQSSRETKVKVDGKEYSGIPVTACVSCHKSEKSVATSYQGLIEKEGASPSKYIHLKEDVHFLKGMMCQDCHTSNDMHGDGFLNRTSATAVEVECQDCHGTTSSYPWELPLGYSDEFNTTAMKGQSRGTVKTVAEYLKQGSVAEVKEGYLLSARGNPLTHTQKDGNKIVIHLANGKNIELRPLKKLKEDKQLSQKALLAMDSISSHTKNMECYTCHSVWAPQVYENQLEIDFSKKDFTVNQTKGFVRWEEPSLMQNAEGRIAPALPLPQAVVSVVGENATQLLYKTPHANPLNTSPIQPHTVQKEARSCESCHTSPKAMGMGISGLKESQESQVKEEESTTQLDAFKFLAPLSHVQKDKLDRSDICISCHKDIPKGDLAISTMTHITQMADMQIDNDKHKSIVNKALYIGTWTQVLLAGLILLFVLFGIYILFFKKQPKNPRNEGWK